MRALRRIGRAALVAISLAAVGWLLYRTNATPVVAPIGATEALAPTRPFVVKLHAQWCPVCLATKGVWDRIAETYADQVNFVVFDFTNAETSAASRAEAGRLGLTAVYKANQGWTGAVLLVDGASRTEHAAIHGSRDFDVYRAAIDALLAPPAAGR